VRSGLGLKARAGGSFRPFDNGLLHPGAGTHDLRKRSVGASAKMLVMQTHVMNVAGAISAGAGPDAKI
jgi:hypothetical protein